jgi:hypothetical protein
MLMCTACRRQHDKFNKAHAVVSVDGQVGQSGEESEKRRIQSEVKCRLHPSEVMRLCCTDCSVVVCGLCLVLEHSGHKAMLLSKGAEIERNRIAESRQGPTYHNIKYHHQPPSSPPSSQ